MTTKIMTALLAVSLAFSCSSEEKSKTAGSDKTIYSCPMHHEVREYKEGKCPVCGMELAIVPDIVEW